MVTHGPANPFPLTRPQVGGRDLGTKVGNRHSKHILDRISIMLDIL